VSGIVFVLLLILLGFQWRRFPLRDGYWFWRTGVDFFAILVGFGLLASLFLDFVCIAAALNSISSEIINGTWDLLRLTVLREGELVLAKHAITQLRVWRTTMWVIGLRIAATVIAAFFMITDYVLEILSQGYLTIEENIEFILFILVPFALLFCIFTIEPLWRMQAMSALGMVISARLKDGALAALLAIGTVLAVWCIQALVLFTLVASLGAVVAVLSPVIGSSAFIISPLIVFPTVYGFYSVLKTWALRQVARRLFALSR
jgi:hypothetical protein